MQTLLRQVCRAGQWAEMRRNLDDDDKWLECVKTGESKGREGLYEAKSSLCILIKFPSFHFTDIE